ncbi:hypothetical protein KFK09_020681 [Dendrobium nobile]|uniref:DUF4283 domain-containing protein n=1 Tax=Dendrobium nobile TaxID=94219 RepID=A0A8T3AN52_DENNO|nr:hypothetical protein KFK09_020681 [Dendrobium nobile]
MALDPSAFPPLPGTSALGAPPRPLVSYADNLASPPVLPDDWPMSFITPTAKLSISTDELAAGKSIWTHSLVGYSIGPRPYYERLLGAMNKAWKLKGSFSLLSMADGFFLLKFTSAEDMEYVFSGGPWFLLGKAFILQKWNPKFKPIRDESALIPIWIKILDLPLALWTPAGISKIASFVGIPLSVDSLTAKRTRLTFARVCIHISKDSKLPDEIPLDLDGEDMTLKVVYDWKPTPCEGCGSLFHPFSLCPSNPNPKPAQTNIHSRGRSKSRRPLPRSSAPTPNPSLPNQVSSNSPPAEAVLVPPSITEPNPTPPLLSLPPPQSVSQPEEPNIPVEQVSAIPNLNLPNEESSSSLPSLPFQLIPPQVLINNSFASLDEDQALVTVAGVIDDDAVVSSASLMADTYSHNSGASKEQTPSSSTKSKASSKKPSPPKKTKAKTAKKAKNPR